MEKESREDILRGNITDQLRLLCEIHDIPLKRGAEILEEIANKILK